MPATLPKTSSRPNRSRRASTAAKQASGSATSARKRRRFPRPGPGSRPGVSGRAQRRELELLHAATKKQTPNRTTVRKPMRTERTPSRTVSNSVDGVTNSNDPRNQCLSEKGETIWPWASQVLLTPPSPASGQAVRIPSRASTHSDFGRNHRAPIRRSWDVAANVV